MGKSWKMKRIIARFLTLCVLLSVPVSVKADTGTDIETTEKIDCKDVKVAWYEDSYHITGKNGTRSGYAYEFEQALAAYTGWDYDFVSGDWSELLEKLETGQIDLMAALSYTDERAEKVLFSDQPMGKEKYFLYANIANSGISQRDVSTLDGKRVILIEKSVQATQFYDWEAKHNVKTKYVYADSIEQAKEFFAKNEADAVVSSETSIWIEDGLSEIYTTGGSDIYFGINKNRPDLKEEIDVAMRSMENDKPFYADDLYKEYLATQSIAALSTEEQEWLAQHGVIRVGYLKHDGGFSTIDSETGKPVGVINDYISYTRNCFGQMLDFELIGFDTSDEQLAALYDDKIDMIFHVSKNPYFAEKYGLTLSNTVLTIPVAAVTTKDTFDESAENTVAVAKNDTKFMWFLSYHYPKWNIVEYDSSNDVEQAVKSGEADCFVVRTGQAMKYSNGKEFHCVFLTQRANSSFAVKRGNVVLMSILNKTLKAMQTAKLTGAISMYEDSMKKVTVADFIKDNSVAVIIGFVSVFLIILIVVLGLLQKARKAEEKAKNANAAKTNFLFNMSHDIRTPMNAIIGYNNLMKKEITDPKLLDYQEKIENAGNLLLSIINNVLDMARIESGKATVDENYSRVGDILKEITEVFEAEAKKKNIHLYYENVVEHKNILSDNVKMKELLTNLASNAIKYTPNGGTVVLRAEELPCEREGYVKVKTQVIDNGIGMSEDYLPTLFDSFTRERNTTAGNVVGTGLGMSIVKGLVDLMGGSIEVESKLGKGTTFTVILEHRIADEVYYMQSQNEITDDAMKEIIKGNRILLAEDNELNAEIATAILKDVGAVIDHVEDGVKCVARMQEMPAGTYDVILMDIQMPNMDGYKATQAIRHLPDKAKANIPIIAMTANAFEEDKKKAFEMGMNGHIAKPISIENIKKTLAPVLGKISGF